MWNRFNLVSILVLLLALAGCGTQAEAEPRPVTGHAPLTAEGLQMCQGTFDRPVTDATMRIIVVWDATASRAHVGLPQLLKDDLIEASMKGGSLTIVAVEGTDVAARPVVANAAMNTPGDLTRPSVSKFAQIIPTCIEEIYTDAVHPQSPGSDVYEALGVAGEFVAQAPTVPTKVWILSDLFTTAGSIGLSPDLLAQDAEAAAEQVAPRAPLDLHGASIHVDGLGGTVDPLLTEHRTWLTTYAQALCEGWNATGCADIRAVPVPEKPRDTTGLPEDNTPVFPTAKPVAHDAGCSYVLPAHLTFAGDSAELRPGAGEILADVTSQLRDADTVRVKITGHTASSGLHTPEQLVDLSLARAQAVATYLHGQGVQHSRIQTQGLGDSQPLAEDIDFSTGLQIPEIAARERRVEVILEGVSCTS